MRPEQVLTNKERARFDALRLWRTETATNRGVDPDIIFNNEILFQIAIQHPTTQEDLQKIAGIGPWKARTYGPAVLAIANR